ncbi:MAG TPA: methyl-accepting chemotaxis protein [Rhodanobacteraceae bacterium]|nr:methyl-accepting chemotaxis protein [Rhodanobacteraceae bacterium]
MANVRAWTHTTSFKFTAFTLLAIAGIVVLTASLLRLERGALLHERQQATRSVTESAYAVLEYYYKEEQGGTLTRQQAQQRAMGVIRGMRYGEDGYFWINDMHPRMVMHPMKPELDGKDLSDMKDPDGLRLFVAFVDLVKASATHDGFQYYLWPKPGAAKPVEKVSYVKEFVPWGWVLGSGVYLGDVSATVWSQALGAGLAAGGIAALLLFVGVLLSRRLVSQLGAEPDAVIAIAKRMARGDLRGDIALRHGDHHSLLQAMHDMRDGIARAVAEVRQGTEVIGESVAKIMEGNESLSTRTEQQAASLQETAASMEEITGTVSNNATNAQEANHLAESASEVAVRGGDVTQQVVATMGEVNATTSQMSDIIGVIDGIAFQTNILALNASVEAARAGEQGRGFAVVASEVRALAQRSGDAAREIRELIDSTIQKIQASTAQADNAGQTMSEIVASVKKVKDIMGEITLASSEQTTGIEQVSQAVSEMDQVTQQNANMVVEASVAVQALSEQMDALNRAMQVFQLPDAGVRGERAQFAMVAPSASHPPAALRAKPKPKRPALASTASGRG